MRKILILFLVLIIIAGFSFSSLSAPIGVIRIDGMEELIELQKMLEAAEENLIIPLLQSSSRIVYSDDFKMLLSLLERFPIPLLSEKDFRLIRITHNPLNQSAAFSIYYESDDGDFLSFSVRDFRPLTVGEVIKETFNVEPILLYQSDDGNIIIYTDPQLSNQKNIAVSIMDFHGYFMFSDYSNVNIEDLSDFSFEQLAESLVKGSFSDLEEMHERRAFQKGDVNGDWKVDTADALEILRFAVGLPNVIEGNERAMAAADMNRDGKVDTADALIVLRIAVGL